MSEHWELVPRAPNSMASSNGREFWGTLVRPDKTAAPLLERLCLGIAHVMPSLEHGSGTPELIPEKLAAFYREAGGNYDTLFLETKGPSLSFIYKSLGCFHTLQPTSNPFEPPSIPALLPLGFVRWQTIQILLCPDEHARYLQNAVRQWDIPNGDGGYFPKEIPRDSFPAVPDPDMVEWHEQVGKQLEQEYQSRHTPRPFAGDSRRRRADSRSQSDLDHDGYRPKAFSHHPKTRSKDELHGRRRQRSVESWPPATSQYTKGHDYSTTARKTNGSRTASPRPPTPPPRPGTHLKTKTRRSNSKGPSSRRQGPAPTVTVESDTSSVGHGSSTSSSSSEHRIPRRRRGSSDDDRRSRRPMYFSPVREDLLRRHSHDATHGRPYDHSSYPPNTKRERHALHPERAEHQVPSNLPYDELHPPKYTKPSTMKFREYFFDQSGRLSPTPTMEPVGRAYTFGPSGNGGDIHRSTRHSRYADEPPLEKGAHRKRSTTGTSGGPQSGSGDSGSEPWSSAGFGVGHQRWESPSHVGGRRVHRYDG